MGALAENFGMHWAMVVAGGVPAFSAAVLSIFLAKRGQLTLKTNSRSIRHPPFIVDNDE